MATIQKDRNWELHRRGQSDQQRHRRRIKEALRRDPNEILRETEIINSDRKKKVKVPVRALKEYRFQYKKPQEAIGQGEGTSEEGDEIARRVKPGEGEDGEGGEGTGETIYDVEISIRELKEILFEELELPNLEDRGQRNITTNEISFESRGSTGTISNLDKRQTLKENLKRNVSQGGEGFGNFHNDDLRYRQYKRKEKPESNAVIFLIRDASGSMGSWKKYITRSMAWWLVEFLRTQYRNLSIEFLLHTTEAQQVSEEAFFERSESGGTSISSAYDLVIDRVENFYPPSRWNIYGFHFSDGENRLSDNERAIERLHEVLGWIQHFGFCAIARKKTQGVARAAKPFSDVQDERFVFVRISDDDELAASLQEILESEREVDRA